METMITRAVSLRWEGEHLASRALLFTLVENQSPYAPQAHLHIAWSYDNEGKEKEAVLHYELALAGELSVLDRFEALFGLACTHRCLGNYDDALDYFKQVIAEYPDADEIKPFYAMCLYHLGRHKEAMEIVLRLLVEKTNSPSIKKYEQAILRYASDLNRKW
ncbi:tetratricopeptide repeat protein [Photobacterium sp. CCB-ST2H9]|uniref:tetratricopeptide repeat protein n=1 Tax=Photobacterium sp. CCB-ST2H9 TaxID=2912855 RepID=UPI0020049FCD|nr:tetratricopeptide repeat protein [Photobacterium sp. CCB-ST2H9]UTM56024.1 tetratricopeptide repeat protein [Photobacterium sp. CCB-ST2H9]